MINNTFPAGSSEALVYALSYFGFGFVVFAGFFALVYGFFLGRGSR